MRFQKRCGRIGKGDNTPICPMPALTLRQSFPMASPMASHNADSDGCPVPGTSVAARTMDIFPIPARRAFAEACKEFSPRFASRNRKNSSPCTQRRMPGASTVSHIEVQLKKRLERIAGALAEASDKSEFSSFGTDTNFF